MADETPPTDPTTPASPEEVANTPEPPATEYPAAAEQPPATEPPAPAAEQTAPAAERPASPADAPRVKKERRDLSRLVADDGDWRVRARNIAAGSLGAGRVGKALAAQQISMARVEDLWPLTL